MSLLILGLRLSEYRLVIHSHATELYAGVVAVLFMTLGVLAGRKLTRPKQIILQPEAAPAPSPAIPPRLEQEPLIDATKAGLSKREHEILLLMAEGLSNQEIAERVFVSVTTVKTHVSNILFKLDAPRRTQAVVKARALNIIP